MKLFNSGCGMLQKDQMNSSSTSTSTISTDAIERIIERLKNDKHQASMKNNYHCVWRKFSEFYLKLDRKPKSWESRVTLFIGHLVNCNKKSGTIKSYISALKSILMDDGIELKEDKYLLSSLT